MKIEFEHNLRSTNEAHLNLIGEILPNVAYNDNLIGDNDWFEIYGKLHEIEEKNVDIKDERDDLDIEKGYEINGKQSQLIEISHQTTRLMLDRVVRWALMVEDGVLKYLRQIIGGINTYNADIELKKAIRLFRPRPGHEFPLTQKQLDDIQELIYNYQDAFLADYWGYDKEWLSEDRIQELKKLGYLLPDAKLRHDFATEAYLLARFSDVAKRSSDYAEMIRLAKTRPLTLAERAGIRWLKMNGAVHIKGLGNDFSNNIREAVVKALQLEIRKMTIGAKEMRVDWKRLQTELRHSFDDYTRNWGRIARTELNNAQQEGACASIIDSNKGKDPLVCKIPGPKACEECLKFFVNFDGSLKVYRLSELIANGSNVGRRRSEWLPVVDSIHPNCECALSEWVEGLKVLPYLVGRRQNLK